MPDGYYQIPGVQEGVVTLAERLHGLEPVLEAVDGAAALDLGCGEGLIARELCDHGARRVDAVNVSTYQIGIGRQVCAGRPVHFYEIDLDATPPGDVRVGWGYDVVLALGIAQKVRRPFDVLELAFSRCMSGGLVAVRAPYRMFATKRNPHGPRWNAEAYCHNRSDQISTDTSGPGWLGIYRKWGA